MATPQASSRLEMLQARFQQKQMQEKEQKLLQLYDQQQQRAYQVVQRGSAGSTGSTTTTTSGSVTQHNSVTRTTTTTHTSSTTQGGKVRQMFDERRQTTVKGIDRSYPLEPLDNKPKKQIAVVSNGNLPSKNRSNPTVTRQSVTVKRTARADVNSNVNGGKPVVSYHEEVSHESFGNDNDSERKHHNRKYYSENDGIPRSNGVHIEELLDDDTIQRNRMMAKIHLMEFDKSMKHRVDNDLNNEEFPEELMVDVPERTSKKPLTKKLSQAEARLERFKNANAKRLNNSVNVANATNTVRNGARSEPRKKSEPMFPAAKTTPRRINIWSKTTESVNARRSATKPPPKPVPLPETTSLSSRNVSPKSEIIESVPVEPSRTPRTQRKGVTPKPPVVPVVPAVKSSARKLSRDDQLPTINAKPSPRIQKSPSPEPTGRRSSQSSTSTTTRRSVPTSPSKSPDIPVSRRNSTPSKSPEPKPSRRSLPTNHGTTRTNHQVSRTSEERSLVDASDRPYKAESYSKFESKSPRASPTATIPSRKTAQTFVVEIDEESKENEPTVVTRPPIRNVSAERSSTTRNQRQSSPTASPSPRPTSALSTASSSVSSPRASSAGSQSPRKMSTKSKTPGSGISQSSVARGSPSPRISSTTNDSLVPCKNCGRRFAQDRVTLHEKICTKTAQKKRKQFDVVSHRVRGTELEAFAKKATGGKKAAERRVKSQKPEAKSNWRRKHEDFINAIRSAKQMQQHLAAGGKLSDLPPPPPSDTSDYVQCPHCGRKFNQGAAERHISKCATMLHNKQNNRNPPKPRR